MPTPSPICVFNTTSHLIDITTPAVSGPGVFGQPVVLNSNGVIDPSLLGNGVTAIAGENLAAGALINLYVQSGTLYVQNAYAAATGTAPSGAPYPVLAAGFVASITAATAVATVSFTGIFTYVDTHSEFSASDIGSQVYLSPVDKGGVTKTRPSSPSADQSVGYVVAYTSATHTVTVRFLAGFQDFSQISGIAQISQGGTGANTAPGALVNLIGGSPTAGQVLTWSGTAWVPGSGDALFADIGSGTNTTATMTVGSGASLTFSGTGVVNANQLTGDSVNTSGRTTGQVLAWNGTAWAPTSADTPAAPVHSFQYNNSGAFGGTSGLTWDSTQDLITMISSLSGSGLSIETDNAAATGLSVSVNSGTVSLTADPTGVVLSEQIGSDSTSISLQQGFGCQVIDNSALYGGGGSGISLAALHNHVFIGSGHGVRINANATTDAVTPIGGLAIVSNEIGFNVTPVVYPTVTGQNNDAVLASLLTGLASTGFITNSTTAGSTHPSRTIATSASALVSDDTIYCNGTLTLTLPGSGFGVGQRLWVKNIGTGAVTVSSPANIDGQPSYFLTTQYQSAVFEWDGTTWWVF